MQLAEEQECRKCWGREYDFSLQITGYNLNSEIWINNIFNELIKFELNIFSLYIVQFQWVSSHQLFVELHVIVDSLQSRTQQTTK